MKLRPMAVFELNKYINRQLSFDPILSQVLVIGEMSNVKLHSSGHMYFTLKDDQSKIQCVMFRSEVMKLKFVPEDGEKVEISGRVAVYEKEGRYQIYVNQISPIGKGELFRAFQELKSKLAMEGYFDKQKPVEKFPDRIGVVTSPTSAAVRDILTVIKRRNPLVEILIYPVRVQGQTAALEIATGIDYFNEHPVDTIIVSRGGGSLEELWAFNEMIVAESIFASEIPVISGVGHETDFTITDFVADMRAATPSEAAEKVVVDLKQYVNQLTMYRNRLQNGINVLMQRYNDQLNRYNKNKLCQLIESHVKIKRETLELSKTKFIQQMNEQIKNASNKLEKLALRLDGASPLTTLSRGYGIIEKNNLPIQSVDDVNKEEIIDIVLKNGIIKAEVIDIERKPE